MVLVSFVTSKLSSILCVCINFANAGINQVAKLSAFVANEIVKGEIRSSG